MRVVRHIKVLRIDNTKRAKGVSTDRKEDGGCALGHATIKGEAQKLDKEAKKK